MTHHCKTLLALVLLAGVSACNQTEKSATNAVTSAAPATAPSAAEPVEMASPVTTGEPATTLAAGEIPTPADFEVEVQEKLVTANLEVELDALEREIGN